MKKKHPLKALLAALMLASFGQAFAATTDTQQAPTAFFVSSDEQLTDTTSTYRRWQNNDWGWTHNAIAGTFTSATLSIRAYDVDFLNGEIDNISAFNFDENMWIDLGALTGTDKTWSISTFDLKPNWFSSINSGLRVRIDIDTGLKDTTNPDQEYWAVSLSQSALSVETTPVPVPAAAWLLGSGLLGLAGVARRKAA